MKLTYEAILNDPSILARIREEAHRERAAALRRLIVGTVKRLFNSPRPRGAHRAHAA